jgi:deoxyribodipyrimidine photo-lyase
MERVVDERRVNKLNSGQIGGGPVVYWMSRDQRVEDNWALLYARELALAYKTPLLVVFCLVPEFLGAALRHYRFMLNGLAEVEAELGRLNIGFYLLTGMPGKEIPRFCNKFRVGALVGDFSPLRINIRWKEEVTQAVNVPFWEVDAHNIVPCRIASPKQEYAAYTFRPKIKKLLPEFLTDFPPVKKHPFTMENRPEPVDWLAAEKMLKTDRTVNSTASFVPGKKAAWTVMRRFLELKLSRYEKARNDPARDGQSNLSPYLHFGQLSAQRAALLTGQAEAPGVYTEAFLEELVIRRELSDNFCFYNERYDSTESFPNWAKQSLADHLDDPREFLYSREEFEAGMTHDRLWNTAQKEMALTGKMHGYMRMYWAKKILEWTESPEEAVKIAIYLNDKYSLDGRDPNGYAGIAWSIGGVHDRAWFQRPIFGKIRYMSYNGSKSKFNIDHYIDKVNPGNLHQ